MGRSPGKWIKTVLFGKKSSKSSLSKNSTAEKKVSAAAKAVSGNLAVDCPATSDLPPQSTDIGRENSEGQNGTRAALPRDAVVSFPGMQGGVTEASAGLISANNAEITELEQAAIKAQAVFRGFLARRAFRALKGIIKLQALVRGHLVRRQAVATLRCMQAIVKFQALVRGRKDAKVVNLSGAWSEKLSTNAFVRKLRASLPTALPLSLQYDLVEPNSAWNWLERWTSSLFWEPVAQAKKIRGSKPQRKQADVQTTDTEPGKPKRGVRKVSAVNGDNSSFHSTSEHEKLKRNPRKALSHQAELVQEQPQSELERVKRSLKKISVSTEEPSHKSEAVTEKKLPSFPVPDVFEQEKGNTLETISDPTVTMPKESMVETPPKPLDMTHDDQPSAEQYPLGNGGTIERNPIIDEDLSPKEEQTSKENERTRRRRSFPAKQEYPENVSQNTPTLPSYMAATESAKAKLRAQGSPRLGQDEVENGFTRRHSLPSNTNGKLNSLSPRMPKPIQTNGKGGSRSDRPDRSLLSSRDGWKR